MNYASVPAFQIRAHLNSLNICSRTESGEEYYRIAKVTGRPMGSWYVTRHSKKIEIVPRVRFSDHLPLWVE